MNIGNSQLANKTVERIITSDTGRIVGFNPRGFEQENDFLRP